MTTRNFYARDGLGIINDAQEYRVQFLTTTSDPSVGGLTADLGSVVLFQDGTDGRFFQKVGATDNDWSEMANKEFVQDQISQLASGMIWRDEIIKVATGDTTGITQGATITGGEWTFSDSDQGAITLLESDYVLVGVNTGLSAIWEVIDDVGTLKWNQTSVIQPAVGNLFYIENYLPDASGAENQTIVVYASTTGADHTYLKLADIDFGYASGIAISNPYNPAAGDISVSDSVQSALEKNDGNTDAIRSVIASTYAQGDSTLGAFSGIGDVRIYPVGGGTLKQCLSNVANDIGIAVTPVVRTSYPVSDQPVNNNIMQVDKAIGSDDQFTGLLNRADSTQVPSVSNTVMENIKALNLAVGGNVTPEVRTNGAISTTNSNSANIGAVDTAIGADADMTSTNTINTSNNIYGNLSALDEKIQSLIFKQTINQTAGSPKTLATFLFDGHFCWEIKISVFSATRGRHSVSLFVSSDNVNTPVWTEYADIRTDKKVIKNVSVAQTGGTGAGATLEVTCELLDAVTGTATIVIV